MIATIERFRSEQYSMSKCSVDSYSKRENITRFFQAHLWPWQWVKVTEPRINKIINVYNSIDVVNIQFQRSRLNAARERYIYANIKVLQRQEVSMTSLEIT